MVRDAIIELFPPDVPRLVRWRLAVSLAIAMFMVHIAWACGLMPNASGFARADEVDEKISAAVDTLYKEIGKVAKQQAVSVPIEDENTYLTGLLEIFTGSVDYMRLYTAGGTYGFAGTVPGFYAGATFTYRVSD